MYHSGRKEVGVKGTIFLDTKYAGSMLGIFFLALAKGLVEERFGRTANCWWDCWLWALKNGYFGVVDWGECGFWLWLWLFCISICWWNVRGIERFWMGIVWAAPYIQFEVVSLWSFDMREVTNLTIIVTTLAFKGICRQNKSSFQEP